MRFVITFFVSACWFFSGCTPALPEIKWNNADTDITGVDAPRSTQIDLDIYLDATSSMEGFAVSNSSVYGQFLDQLEISAGSAWAKTNVHFFKFGAIVKPIDRNDFLIAKTDRSFYKEKGIFEKTHIDSVINRADNKRLSVVTSDLFQSEADVNSIVEHIKEKCFARGIVVGIIGVKSDFAGTVFDVPQYPKGYKLTGERPFYAIVFGNTSNMERLFDALKIKSFVKEDQFLVISKYIIRSSDVTLIKTKDSRFINKKASREIVKNVFDFSMKEEGKEARFDLSIYLERNKRCADFSEKHIEIIAYKKMATDPGDIAPDSVLTDDISLENITRSGDTIKATLVLKNEDETGNYSYAIYLKLNELSGLHTSKWIRNFSTDQPDPLTPEGSKTYHLEKFTSALLVANTSISPTFISKFYINIFKR